MEEPSCARHLRAYAKRERTKLLSPACRQRKCCEVRRHDLKCCTSCCTAQSARAARPAPICCSIRHNPVDWWPWSPEALAARPRPPNKPILLSVGYAACHWCHVMAHESFEDDATAAVMNELFVNIKVDREERPDIDQIYMNALHLLGEQGGWPLTMFLTPDGEPFWGGTYFPKTVALRQAGFRRCAARGRARLSRRAAIGRAEPRRAARTLARTRRRRGSARSIGTSQLNEIAVVARRARPIRSMAACAARRNFRKARCSNICGAPARARRMRASSSRVDLALTQMSQGGIYDHLGGGYSRYSVDERWLVPHFEKMLYDNAQLLELLALEHARDPNPLFRPARRGNRRLADPRDDRRGGRLRLVARRRFGGRGGQVLCLVASRDRAVSRRGRCCNIRCSI